MAKWKKPADRLRLETLEDRSVPSASFSDGDHDHDDDAVVFIPEQFYRTNQSGFLTGPTAAAPLAIARNYLTAHAADLGYSAGDVVNLDVVTNYVSDSTGVTHLGFQQRLNGLLVRNTNISVNVTADGRIVNVAGYIVRGIDRFNGSIPTPTLSAAAAVQSAATHFGLTPTGEIAVIESPNGLDLQQTLSAPGISTADVPMNLQYVATPGGGVELSWDMEIQTPDRQHWYSLNVDETSGEVLYTQDYSSNATYHVYPIPGESPQHITQTTVTDPHVVSPVPAVVPSPFGWHDTNGVAGAEHTITRGNNVFAYLDRDGNNVPDNNGSPDGGASLNFPFVFNPALTPLQNKDVAVTNLFYWNNILHDVHYLYGFNEAARNFQANNYSRGGAGNDAVNAEAQDAADLGAANNANFFTPPDGSPGVMQMYEFTMSNPRRDSDMDAGIIIHEYGHGVSNRLTNNGNGLSNIQSRGMGEGWSDFWSLMLTQVTAGETTAGRGMGTYALNQPVNGPGIRDFRYDFDITNQNFETFLHFSTPGGSQVHTSGTRWAATLWDLNHLLIQKYGYEPNIYDSTNTAGNTTTLHLVLNGLKLHPSNPSFLQARDAILQADILLYAGANQVEIWQAFARRGLGFSASTPGSGSTSLNAAFDLPPNPAVTINQTFGQPDPTNGSSISYSVVFDRVVTGFVGSDISFAGSTVGGNLVASVSGSGAVYTVTVTGMAGEGDVVASVPAGVATDLFGTTNRASTSQDNVVRFDAVGPTVTVNQAAGQPDPVTDGPVSFDVVFGDPVTGFDASDVSFAGSTIGGTLQANVTGSGTTYTVTVSGMSGLGTVALSVPAGATVDGLGNSSLDSTSIDNTITVDTVGQVAFEVSEYTRLENGGTATITAIRTGGSANAVSVDYSVTGGSATTDIDFQPGTGTINWANGETGPKTFQITILDDILDEGDETLELTLLNPGGGVGLGGQVTTTLKIEDVEEGIFQYISSAFNVSEDGGLITVSVSRSGGDDGAITVDYATADDTARVGLDYLATSGTLSWAAGEMGVKTFEIEVLPDEHNEGRENIRIDLSNPTNNGHLGLALSRVSIAPSDPKGPGKFIDADGDKGTVRLAFGGTLGYYLTDPDGDGRGPIELIELTGTNPLRTVVTLTSLKVPTTADAGRIGLGAVTGTGVKAINARPYNLDGDGVNLPALTSLVIGDVKNGADILIGGTPAQKVRIAAWIIGDGSTIDVDRTLTGLNAVRIGDSDIIAPAIGSIVARGHLKSAVPGNFAADVDVSGSGVLAGKPALKVLRAAGEITSDSNVLVNGLSSVLAAGSFNGTFNAGGLTKMALKGKMGGDLILTGNGVPAGKPVLGSGKVVVEMLPEASVTAPSIGTFTVRGFMHGDITVSGQGVTGTMPALKSLVVTGTVSGSDISVGGNVGLVQAALFQNSHFYAGYSGPDDGSGTFTTPATVGTFRVTDAFGGFENSMVIASTFKTVRLAYLDSENGGEKFGFIADQGILSLSAVNPLSFVYDPANPEMQGRDDFEVRIV